MLLPIESLEIESVGKSLKNKGFSLQFALQLIDCKGFQTSKNPHVQDLAFNILENLPHALPIYVQVELNEQFQYMLYNFLLSHNKNIRGMVNGC